MRYRTDKEAFGAYISDLREKRRYRLEQVCEGLCSAQRLFQLEGGNQAAGKLLQDAILERLGVGAEDYEHYLHFKEYDRWEMRQRILHRISCGKPGWARELLEEYNRRYKEDFDCSGGVGERLERQFYLSMQAQIRQMEGAGTEEMRTILDEAVQLTVPGLWKKPLRGRVLSLKEWNLILEAERYREGGGEEIHYREILSCLEIASLDTVGMAKIYPKAVCFLCGCIMEKEEDAEAELLGYCSRAVEILRNASRMYYMWELLALRERYLKRRMGNRPEARMNGEFKERPGEMLEARVEASKEKQGEKPEGKAEKKPGKSRERPEEKTKESLKGKQKEKPEEKPAERLEGKTKKSLKEKQREKPGEKAEERSENESRIGEDSSLGDTDFAGLYAENAGWKKVLEDVYMDYGIQKETFHYCYLYLENDVSCISDVIRIRRKMLGIKAEDLCRGICDIKTLRRLENRKRATQRAIVYELFERLGLPGEMTRTELVTDSPEARQMMEMLRFYENERKTEKAEMLLFRIKRLVTTEMRCNQQALMRKETNLRRNRGEITGVEYYRQMHTALELTLPFDAFLKKGEKYLTHEEQACIQNMMYVMDKEGKDFGLCMKRFEEMYRPVAEGELLGTIGGIYGLIMGYVASELGNRGEHDQADWYSGVLVKEELRSRRIASLARCLYDRYWNYTERKRKGISTGRILDGEEELTKCILLSDLLNQEYYKSIYQEKLKREQI